MADTVTNDVSRQDYTGPVARLLIIGDASLFKPVEWPNYPELYGLGNEHIPALIRMACDLSLHRGDTEGAEIWAPVHAWRALAQLRAVEAIEPLLEFTRIELEDDAVSQEFTTVLGMMGPAAIAPIAAFLADRTVTWMGASLATAGLAEIVKAHPECRDECVRILTRLLEHGTDSAPMANAFTISSLLDLKAVEAIDTIRDAFRRGTVDFSIAGDLEDVEIELGLRARRSTPRPYYPFLSGNRGSAKTPSSFGFEDIPDDADMLPMPHKIGRNEPCPCGSGKKYKKCCLE